MRGKDFSLVWFSYVTLNLPGPSFAATQHRIDFVSGDVQRFHYAQRSLGARCPGAKKVGTSPNFRSSAGRRLRSMVESDRPRSASGRLRSNKLHDRLGDVALLVQLKLRIHGQGEDFQREFFRDWEIAFLIP